MSRELIYSVEVAIVRCPGDRDGPGGPAPKPTVVRYCDVCRRWGAAGTTHLCGRNWCIRLWDLLMDLARDVRS